MSHIVVGNGWSALTTVGFLALQDKQVTWVTGSGAHIYSPLSILEPQAAAALSDLLRQLEILDEEAQEGFYLREFRNKSFEKFKKQKIEESIWAPEKRAIPLNEASFSIDLATIEDKIRQKLATLTNIKKIAGVPVKGFDFNGDQALLLLASGESLPAEKIYYADRWSMLSSYEGFPKSKNPARGLEPMGVLQAQFTHSHPLVGADLQEVFTCVMHKDPGEEFMRSVFGYFSDEGKRSVWTVFLEANESEDNHTIAKKLRRLKQTLDRMFSTPEWLPTINGVMTKDFLSTIQHEQVTFEDNFIFASAFSKTSELPEGPILLGDELILLTDGFGPSVAFELSARSHTQNPSVNLANTTHSQSESATL